ncbi:MAG: DUF4900 domain-containing protein [Candidatus Eisenbacteria bacterium]|nr:DUF4900 domain-containing protein [Candidatus Eisenbacteria bacterium]
MTTKKQREGGLAARALSSQTGVALVTVMAIVSAVLLLGVALFTLGVGEGDLVQNAVDTARAFYLAESGLVHGRSVLEGLASQSPATYPTDFTLNPVTVGGGTYTVGVTRRSAFNPWVHEYAVESTGSVGGATATVRGIIRNETFAQYLFYAHHSDDVWFATGDTLDGRVHVNGHLKVSGSPWFGMKVTSSRDNMIVYQGSTPTFMGGYELGVPEVPLPTSAAFMADLSSKAAAGGINCGTLNGPNAKYEVELARNGQHGYLSYRAYRRTSGNRYSWTSWTSVSIANTNGVAWFGSPVDLKGTLDGQLTLGCAGNVTITDDVRYRNSTPGSGPNQGCDDLLGICSAKNVIVQDNAANRNNCEIHAHIMALDSSFTAENYNRGSPRGDLMVYGGIAQKSFGAIGTFRHNGGVVSGYNKRYHFDPRLAGQSPPGYPVTGGYILASWTRVQGQQG